VSDHVTFTTLAAVRRCRCGGRPSPVSATSRLLAFLPWRCSFAARRLALAGQALQGLPQPASWSHWLGTPAPAVQVPRGIAQRPFVARRPRPSRRSRSTAGERWALQPCCPRPCCPPGEGVSRACLQPNDAPPRRAGATAPPRAALTQPAPPALPSLPPCALTGECACASWRLLCSGALAANNTMGQGADREENKLLCDAGCVDGLSSKEMVTTSSGEVAGAPRRCCWRPPPGS